ncbi:hypothetical protein BHM03_00044686 [Ensete ventricosum]|nr:hypothetical protein BHM03_00044686 [Ensete ventricosum]
MGKKPDKQSSPLLLPYLHPLLPSPTSVAAVVVSILSAACSPSTIFLSSSAGSVTIAANPHRCQPPLLPPRPSPLSHYSRAFLPSTAAHNPLVAAALVIPSPDATATHYRNRFQPCPLLLPPSLPCSCAAIPYCSPRCPLPQHSASPTTVAATQPRRCPLPQPSPFPVAALVVPCRNPRRPQPLPSSFSPLLQSSPIAAVARSCFLLCCRSNCPHLLPHTAAFLSRCHLLPLRPAPSRVSAAYFFLPCHSRCHLLPSLASRHLTPLPSSAAAFFFPLTWSYLWQPSTNHQIRR